MSVDLVSMFPPLQPEPLGSFWWPINVQQQAALESSAELLLYGGGSGGGKSDWLVADAVQEYQNPNLRALLLRKAYSDMAQLNDRMEVMYRPLGARWKGDEHVWIFPSGARIRTGYLSADKDLGKYRGNSFSWLGVDEVGEQPEDRVRKMIPWLASTDPTLRIRARFTANPGGEGMAWLLRVFLRSKCPIHNPADFRETHRDEMSVYPGRVYSGSKWRSDDGLTNKTVSFIPALAKDNPLYDQRKIDSLLSQTADVQEHLLHGCWCKSEGMYFPFMKKDMLQSYADLNEEWWWNHFISIDYGYSNSSAAATLYGVNEKGIIYILAERVEKKLGSDQFIQLVIDDWIKPACTFPGQSKTNDDQKRLQRWMQMERPIPKERRRFICCYIDPANDSHDGTGQSNMEIMQEYLAPYGISMVKASKDADANALQLHRRLRTGQVVVCDTAPETYDSVSTRICDDKRMGAVKKIKGDPLDDVIDSVMYGINTWLQTTVKPQDVVINEKISKMASDGVDDRSLLIHRSRLEKEKKPEGGVIPLGRRRIGQTRVRQ